MGIYLTLGFIELVLRIGQLLCIGLLILGFLQFGAAHRQLDFGALEASGVAHRCCGSVSGFKFGQCLLSCLKLLL